MFIRGLGRLITITHVTQTSLRIDVELQLNLIATSHLLHFLNEKKNYDYGNIRTNARTHN
jgi:hypothetical protein